MSVKHYPYMGGAFDRIVFDGDGSVWVPEAENDKLREELADAPKCETCEAMLDCDECLRADGSHKERRRLSAENAKLRELVGYFLRCERCLCDGCPLNEHGACSILDKAEELGFEVPE